MDAQRILFLSEVGVKTESDMKNFVFSMVAVLVLGTAFAAEKSQAPAKQQTAAAKGDSKAVAAACDCNTVEVVRKATRRERLETTRNLGVVETVKFVELKSSSCCDCCDNNVVASVRRPVRRVRGVFDGLFCR